MPSPVPEAWTTPDHTRRDEAQRLLDMLNGDWREDQLVHYCFECPGRCMSVDDARDKVYAALLACGVLPNNDTVPSLKDWGSAWEHCAQQTLGIMCHRVFPRVVDLAIHWDREPPQEPVGDSTAGDIKAHREYLRRKAWRCRCVLTDAGRNVQWAVTTWTVQPVDHLLFRIQWMDERKNSFFDALATNSSPFRQCQRQLFSMLSEPWESSPLAPLYHHFGHSRVQALVWQQICGMAADLTLRFVAFRAWPLRLVRAADSRLSESKRRRIVRDFLEAPACCRNTDFGAKLAAMFPSEEALFGSKPLMNLLHAFGRECRICNMHVERYFARIRKCTARRQGPPEVERLRCGAFLAEVVGRHRKQGGFDPRVIERQRLIGKGVPLRRVKKPGKHRRPPPGFIMFAAAQEAARKD